MSGFATVLTFSPSRIGRKPVILSGLIGVAISGAMMSVFLE